MDLSTRVYFGKLHPAARIPTKRVEDAGYDLYSVLCTLSKIKPLKMEKLFENIVTFAKTQGVKVL